MELQLGNVEINTLAAGTQQLWAMPNYENSPPVDICHPPQSLAGRPR